jgi:hypothetical protein
VDRVERLHAPGDIEAEIDSQWAALHVEKRERQVVANQVAVPYLPALPHRNKNGETEIEKEIETETETKSIDLGNDQTHNQHVE